MLSFCLAWTTATAYSLAVHSFSVTDCRKFRTQLHDLSVGQKTKPKQTNKKHNNNKNLDHPQPILQSLHWLPIRARVQYKISTLRFSVITGTGPQYLSELLHLYTPSRDLRSPADSRILKIPRSNSKAFSQRLFSHVGPSIWNGLYNTVSAILTLRHHLDRLRKPISFNKVSNLLLLFL